MSDQSWARTNLPKPSVINWLKPFGFRALTDRSSNFRSNDIVSLKSHEIGLIIAALAQTLHMSETGISQVMRLR